MKNKDLTINNKNLTMSNVIWGMILLEPRIDLNSI